MEYDAIDKAMDRSLGSIGRVMIRRLDSSGPSEYREHAKDVSVLVERAMQASGFSDDLCTYAIVQLLIARMVTRPVVTIADCEFE